MNAFLVEIMEKIYEGKSKDVYRGDLEGTCVLAYKDATTAFDGKKSQDLAGKGALNAAISQMLYKFFEKNGIKTHLIDAIDHWSVLVKQAQIIPVEVIVRNIAAGGFSEKYGIEEGVVLKAPTLEFSLKDDSLGDPMINISQIVALDVATAEELADLQKSALKINELMKSVFEKAGICLVDFKLEFGRTAEGIILCDEISPDSCRLWDTKSGKKLDKDRFRRDLGEVVEAYQEVYERLKDVIEI